MAGKGGGDGECSVVMEPVGVAPPTGRPITVAAVGTAVAGR